MHTPHPRIVSRSSLALPLWSLRLCCASSSVHSSCLIILFLSLSVLLQSPSRIKRSATPPEGSPTRKKRREEAGLLCNTPQMASHHRSDSTVKPLHLDIPLSDLPSTPDSALNSPKAEQYKSENGFLRPEAIRRLSTSTIDGLSDDGRSGRSHSQASYRRNYSPAPLNTWKASAERFWQRIRGL